MRSGVIRGLVVAGLCLASPTVGTAGEPGSPRSAEKSAPPKPTLQLRLAPLEDLIGSLRYLVKKIGREEEGKQLEEMLKSRTGPQGLEGIDTKKPIGLVGTIHKQLDKAELLFLLPIADEKTFLDFLDRLDYKPKKDKDGLYTLKTENVPFPMLFRFANGYLYGTLKFTASATIAPAESLPKPEAALGAGSGVLSLSIHLDALPPAVRKTAVPAAALYLGSFKDRELPPGTTEKQKELRDGLLDEMMRIGKQLIDDGASLRLQVDLDRKKDALEMALRVEGPKTSSLARDITALAGRASLGPAFMSKESVMGGYLNAPLPASLRKRIEPVIDEFFEKHLKDAGKDRRDLFTPFVEAMKPTLTADSLTLAADVRGPARGGKYTLALYHRARKGEALEKAIRDLLARAPKDAPSTVKIDVAKAGGTAIHQVQPQGMSENTKTMFGTTPVYLAINKEAVVVTGGETGLDSIKELAVATPAAGKLLYAQLSARRLGEFLEKSSKKGTRDVIDRSFADKVGDKVTLSVDGGARFDLRLSIDLAVIKFAYLMDEAGKKKDKD